MPCRVSWLVNDLTAVDWPAKRVGVVGIPSLVGAQSPVILLTFPVKTEPAFPLHSTLSYTPNSDICSCDAVTTRSHVVIAGVFNVGEKCLFLPP